MRFYGNRELRRVLAFACRAPNLHLIVGRDRAAGGDTCYFEMYLSEKGVSFPALFIDFRTSGAAFRREGEKKALASHLTVLTVR